jgi:phosphoserine phosphatase
MECEIAVADQGASARPTLPGSRSHVIVLGRPLRPGAVSWVAQRIADMGGNIETITQLSSEPTSALEMLVRTEDPHALRAVLAQAADDTGVDIAVEPAGLQRRAKRLVLLDVDSTLIQIDPLAALAAAAGAVDQVNDISEQELAGELDLAESLRQRVALLAGLPEEHVEEVRASLTLAPGAERFVGTLRRLGYYVGLVSGGFTAFTDRFVAELGVDFAAANELEIVDGVLTGRIAEPILDQPAMGEALRRFADKYGVPLSQTVAVGDGARNVELLDTAGLGIAYNARSALRAVADAPIDVPFLDSVLYVLGISRDELEDASES